MVSTPLQPSKIAEVDLGRIGIWSSVARYATDDERIGAVQELEQLGFPTLWLPGGIDDGVLEQLDTLLEATSVIKFGTGILNIWKHAPADVAAWWHGKSPEHQSRLILGLGVSHAPLIGDAWKKPLARMGEYLDGLDAAGMPRERLCLAALGPKMLELAAERTAGGHSYLVSPAHTAFARKIMGPDALLAPEQGVILERDPEKARAIGRDVIRQHAALPNYTNNWLRDGFTQQEIDNLSDRLIDALIAWGDLDAIAARVAEHLAAGADHVCLQTIRPGGRERDIVMERAGWRELALLSRNA